MVTLKVSEWTKECCCVDCLFLQKTEGGVENSEKILISPLSGLAWDWQMVAIVITWVVSDPDSNCFIDHHHFFDGMFLFFFSP